MVKEFQIRYGRFYKIIIAIILPSFLIAPFILLLHRFGKSFEEWQVWITIFSFLGFIILLSIWLVFQVYPMAILSINKNELSLTFKQQFSLLNTNFTFTIEDITDFKELEIAGAAYFVFETRNPTRKFQISALRNTVDDILLFNEAMAEISEMLSE